MQVSAFNDMCGDYFDTLHVQVSGEVSGEDEVKRGHSLDHTKNPATLMISHGALKPDLTQVGNLPLKDIPVRVGVAGTPLIVQKERVLTKGLRGRTWCTGIEYGEVCFAVGIMEG